MPRDVNGNYTLPPGNPVVPDTTIEAAWANPTMEDIKTELTNSLSRDGYGGMRAPFKNADGTTLAPGVSWGNEPTSGWYRKTTNEFWYSVGNEDIFGISKTGIILASGKNASNINIPPFPAGTRMLFQQTNAPAGWVKEVSGLYADAAIRLTTGTITTGGAVGFSGTFGPGKTTDGLGLSVGHLPPHSHNFSGITGFENQDHSHGYADFGPWGGGNGYTNTTNGGATSADVGRQTGGITANHQHFFNGTTDGGNGLAGVAHSHSLSILNLKFVDFIVATKS